MKSLQNAASPLEATRAPGPSQAGHVLEWVVDPTHYCAAHERITRRALAERIAALQGMQYAGSVSRRPPPRGPLYFIPSDTVESHRAAAIGIRSELDFFGGAVPFPYVATKAISHPLQDAQAQGPHDWIESFAPRVASCVLPGTTAFSEADARRAGRALLREGDVRIKPVRATGGNAQTVVQDGDALERTLAQVPEIASDGVVLERNLRAPRTLSIGQVKVGPLTISYYGLQRTTRNHRGKWVYGGSDLTAVRGAFDALTRLPLEPTLRLAIDQAAVFHAAVVESFPGFMASRINYDVAQGEDQSGRWYSGVLEQSWRVGGATGAEVAALEVFKNQPARAQVRASCFEVFGETALPPGARVSYSGEDPEVGRLTKYSFVDAHDDAA